MRIDRIRESMERGDLELALNQIDELGDMQRLQGKIIKSRILEKQGKYQEAYHLATETLYTSKKEGRKEEIIGSYIAKAYALFRLNQFEEALEDIKEGQHVLENYNFDEYINKKQYEATLFNAEGLVYRYKGEFSKAEEAYQKSLEIRLKLDLKSEIAGSLTNLGTIYQLRGEMDKALHYHLDALQMFRTIDNQLNIAYVLHDIAGIYLEKDKLEKAIDFYNRALEIREERGNYQTMAETLFELIRLFLDLDDTNSFNHCFNKLKDLCDKSDNKHIKPYYELSRAYKLQKSNRLINRAEAQKIFKKYIDESIDFQLQKFAMLNLCNLLIRDLKSSKNEDILQEVRELILEFLDKAKKQHSSPLLVEIFLLQSKLALIQLDLEKSRKLLAQAEVMAREKELHHATIKISHEHDNMIDKLGRWDDMKKHNASVIERLEATDMEKTIDDMINRRKLDLDRNYENPLFLLILNNKAITLYSKKFVDDITINEQLIGGFLMATNFSINRALDSNESFERIKYGQYNLIFIQYSNLTFCYAYEGQSYFAVQRLNAFIDRIKLGRSWDLLTQKIIKPKQITHELREKIQNYFLQPNFFESRK